MVILYGRVIFFCPFFPLVEKNEGFVIDSQLSRMLVMIGSYSLVSNGNLFCLARSIPTTVM